jgi:hypothetical protein
VVRGINKTKRERRRKTLQTKCGSTTAVYKSKPKSILGRPII